MKNNSQISVKFGSWWFMENWCEGRVTSTNDIYPKKNFNKWWLTPKYLWENGLATIFLLVGERERESAKRESYVKTMIPRCTTCAKRREKWNPMWRPRHLSLQLVASGRRIPMWSIFGSPVEFSRLAFYSKRENFKYRMVYTNFIWTLRRDNCMVLCF